jgi:catechol 2,3-dioxygenase-like lactoylglutathione lyase family enzyme
MTIQLNHTIVQVRNKVASARFYTELLGLPEAQPYGPFMVVALPNDVSLDFLDVRSDVSTQHYAFLVDDAEFDAIFARIRERELDYWADPGHQEPGRINHNDGGQGVYWADPDGHNLEIITRPYGDDRG